MALGLSIFLIITSVVMILLVLLHKGKGAGLSDLFGGGVSSNYGGSSVVERNLDRITIVVGGLWFALLPMVHGAPIPRSTKRMGSVLRSKLVKVMIAINLLFVGSFSALEIGAVAAVGQAEAGFVIAMLSIGSVLGGLAFGHRARSPLALSKQLAVVLLGDLLIFFNATDPFWLGVCLFISLI